MGASKGVGCTSQAAVSIRGVTCSDNSRSAIPDLFVCGVLCLTGRLPAGFTRLMHVSRLMGQELSGCMCMSAGLTNLCEYAGTA